MYLLSAMCYVFAMYLDRICSASAAYLQHVFVVYCNVQCIVYSVHCSDVQDRSQFASSSEENFSSPGKKVKLSQGGDELKGNGRCIILVSSEHFPKIYNQSICVFVYICVFAR